MPPERMSDQPIGAQPHAPLPQASTPTPPATVDIRPLMSGFPTGVSVVTAFAGDGTPWGMTCTSLCSVSLDPPVVLVCLGARSHTLRAVRDSQAFAINLLHREGRQAAELFASGALDRFERITWQASAEGSGPHLTQDAHAIADCSVISDVVVGDHAVIMGSACAVTPLRPQQPLLYGMRRFFALPEPADSPQVRYEYIP